MSESPNFAFGKLVPGFDFLQNLASSAASAAKGASQALPQLPSLGNWVAPTLNVEDVDKRIGELKAVLFWLDQNATALKATIQALEVQKMTLATLKGMNFDMAQMAEAFKLKAPAKQAVDLPGAPAAAPAAPSRPRKVATRKPVAAEAGAARPGAVVDPLQWWGALTQQFQGIAASAMKDVAQKAALDAAKNAASGIAKEVFKSAGGLAAAAGGSAAKRLAARASKTRAEPARTARGAR
jgi:hypothetical protein